MDVLQPDSLYLQWHESKGYKCCLISHTCLAGRLCMEHELLLGVFQLLCITPPLSLPCTVIDILDYFQQAFTGSNH